MKARREPAHGGYVHVELDIGSCRIYYETAGSGQPLLCLHTAGSDTRQYRALLNDEELLANYQVIAFDLPYHGKSSPPAGWQERDYALTSDQYVEVVLAFMDAMEIERPVVMGCSIGGRVVLHLGIRAPDRFRALIGLQSGLHVDPYYDLEWLHRPDVHGGEVCAGIVSGLIGPNAPDEDRWETLWHYMQSGPGVFKGDLHFYKSEGDLREQVHQFDTSRSPLFLLTGEYDYSCTPEDSRILVEQIPGAQLKIMPGLGHFPMSESPREFREHLVSVLEQIRELK